MLKKLLDIEDPGDMIKNTVCGETRERVKSLYFG
jgi:hypothetical protein